MLMLRPVVAATWLRESQLLAAVERDLDEHGRAVVVGDKRGWRKIRRLSHALDERIAEHNDISWARGGFAYGRVWLHVVMNDSADPYNGLYFYSEADKPDWWRAMPRP